MTMKRRCIFNRESHGLDDEVHALVDSYYSIKREEVGCDFLTEVGRDMSSWNATHCRWDPDWAEFVGVIGVFERAE